MATIRTRDIINNRSPYYHKFEVEQFGHWENHCGLWTTAKPRRLGKYFARAIQESLDASVN